MLTRILYQTAPIFNAIILALQASPSRQLNPASVESCLLSLALAGHCLAMELPGNPVALSTEQIADLNRKLSKMRHDINNYLAAMTLAAELTRLKPETAGEMMTRLLQQFPRIKEEIATFSAEFERVFGITRP